MLTPEREAEIRARVGKFYRDDGVPMLLAEIDRLRAELEAKEKELRTLRPYKPWPDPLQAENEELRRMVEGAHAALVLELPDIALAILSKETEGSDLPDDPDEQLLEMEC